MTRRNRHIHLLPLFNVYHKKKKYMAGLQLQQGVHDTTQEMPLASHTFGKSDTTASSFFWFRIQPDDTCHASKTLQ